MSNPVIISVGGGKGGVGKSTITANIGALLVRKEFNVGFIDADLGGANLHLCLGVRRPKTGLQDYINGTYKTLQEIAIPTIIPKTWLIGGASDILDLANPNFAQKKKIIKNLSGMDADFILVDLGAGSDNHVTDFFAAFPYGIIVTDGLPTSIENAYGFLKNGILRGLTNLFTGQKELQNCLKKFVDPKSHKTYGTISEMLDGLNAIYPDEVALMRSWLSQRKTLLILNMVKEPDDVKIGIRFVEMVKKYLYINMYYIGYIILTPDMRKAIKSLRPLVEQNPESLAVTCFESVTNNLLTLTKGHH
jgi:flagellar biosynthesis protein FlhG